VHTTAVGTSTWSIQRPAWYVLIEWPASTIATGSCNRVSSAIQAGRRGGRARNAGIAGSRTVSVAARAAVTAASIADW
jgi:hypothetical protein